MYVLTSDEMRSIDQTTIEIVGIPGIVLMENAGRGIVDSIADLAESDGLELSELNVTVICGKGNNGGDGFVVARYLLNSGADVIVYLIGKREDVQGDAKTNLNILLNMGEEVIELLSADELADMALEYADIIVDAIFGTGFLGTPRGLASEAIAMINREKPTHCRVVSIDAPSGVDMSNGRIESHAVKADLTATMALPKVGHIFEPGRSHVGRLEVVDIGIPPAVIEGSSISSGPQMELIDPEDISDLFQKRKFDAFKSDFGKVAVIAGSTGMTGAAALTCSAALRVGAGLVKLGIPKNLNLIMEMKLTETMTTPLAETSTGSLSLLGEKGLDRLTRWANVTAIGPGLSRHPETVELIWREVEKSCMPMVIDADGLNALADKPSILEQSGNEKIVITPHPGEMARLLDIPIRDVLENPAAIIRQAASKFGCTVVLKCAPALVGTQDGYIYVNTTGNPGLATGGSGDVLTGMIAGLLGQGLSPGTAGAAGIFLHGFAADIYVEEKSEYSLIASDLLPLIPRAINRLAGNDKLTQDHDNHCDHCESRSAKSA
ncbi:MAG: hypothetical protein B6244_10215 [Candidatus Cloacimonetes bacterium 4572_55]|nr:MAG: hypothetical protein B6244_10215 [Candidatus Cloacimonetes bacterium 4572_55]